MRLVVQQKADDRLIFELLEQRRPGTWLVKVEPPAGIIAEFPTSGLPFQVSRTPSGNSGRVEPQELSFKTKGCSRLQSTLISLMPINLLLVVNRSAFVLLPLCIGPGAGNGAALAVGRKHNVGRENILAALFGSDVKRVVVGLFN